LKDREDGWAKRYEKRRKGRDCVTWKAKWLLRNVFCFDRGRKLFRVVVGNVEKMRESQGKNEARAIKRVDDGNYISFKATIKDVNAIHQKGGGKRGKG